MAAKPKIRVFICRCQPYHNGHKTVIDQALAEADLVLVCLGSANRSKDTYNPWYPEERELPIRQDHYGPGGQGRLRFVYLDDYLYNDHLWEQHVQVQVNKAIARAYPVAPVDLVDPAEGQCDIKLIGMEKDGTSYYLKKFPQWGNVAVRATFLYSATDIRRAYFGRTPMIPRDIIPESTAEFMRDYLETEEFGRLVEEEEFCQKHKRPYELLPHGHIDQAVDAVVVQSGHVLMIERDAQPGRGLLALPGGYLGEWDGLEEGVLATLVRETGISFTEKPKPEITERILRGSMGHRRRFDYPHRSRRGRIITEAFTFDLEEREHLPWLEAGVGARKASWIPLSQVDPRRCFEDHFFVIQEMIRSHR